MPFAGGPNTRITNPRWRTAAILEKNRKIAISNGFTDRHEICLCDAVCPRQPCRPLKFQILKIQDGGGLHSEK